MLLETICTKWLSFCLGHFKLSYWPVWPAAMLLVCSFATPAYAQIYSWRDAHGNLVLSDRRPGDGAPVQSYAVRDAEMLRVTRPATAERAQPFMQLINQYAQQNGVREDLVRAVVQVESAFNPYARSSKGALGLMQLMPATVRQFGVANPFDPVENVRAGVQYLRQLLDRFGSDERLALAAYNAGPGTVERHGQRIPPFAETRHYVASVSELAGQAPGGSSELATTRIYQVVEYIDGRPVVRYTDRKPAR